MNVESLEVTQEQAVLALQQEYRAGRKNFDKIDREIRRIYRAIAAGKEVISVIGKDAWVVIAAWDLTDIEVAVLRAHRGR